MTQGRPIENTIKLSPPYLVGTRVGLGQLLTQKAGAPRVGYSCPVSISHYRLRAVELTGNNQSPRIQRLGCRPATRSVQVRFGPNQSGIGPSVLSSPVSEVVACEVKFACISTCTSHMHESLSLSQRPITPPHAYKKFLLPFQSVRILAIYVTASKSTQKRSSSSRSATTLEHSRRRRRCSSLFVAAHD